MLSSPDGALRKVSLEVVTAARRLADQVGATVDAVVPGQGPVSGGEQLGRHGADRVLLATHPAFVRHAPDGFAATIAAAGREAAGIVFAATATGRDLAPRVAARLGVSLASEVTEWGVESGKVVVTRPIYGGKALQRLRLDAERRLNDPFVLRDKLYFSALDWKTDGTLLLGAFPFPDGGTYVPRTQGLLDRFPGYDVYGGGRPQGTS